MANRILTALRRRLESAELEHLRRVVAEQGERIVQLEAENARLSDDYYHACRMEDFWRENFHDAAASDVAVGVTRDGTLLIVQNYESKTSQEAP